MIFFFGLTWALMALFIFMEYWNKYCLWYASQDVAHPKLNFIKSLPGRVKDAWLAYVDYVDMMWPSPPKKP